MKNIVLIGFMGAGKSVVAKKLATVLKRDAVSIDDLIVAQEKRPIADIFRDSGEGYFRKAEKGVVKKVSEKDNLIIDCGGGVVLAKENVDHLRKNGIVFYLSASAAVIYERVKNEQHRPLLNVTNPQAKISELLGQRQPYYEKAAHFIVDTSRRTPEEVVSEILRNLPDDRT